MTSREFQFGADASRFLSELEKMILAMRRLAEEADKSGDFELARNALKGANAQERAINKQIEDLQRLQDQLKATEDAERQAKRVRAADTSPEIKKQTKELEQQKQAAAALRIERKLLEAQRFGIQARLAKPQFRTETGQFAERQPARDQAKAIGVQEKQLTADIAKLSAEILQTKEKIAQATLREEAAQRQAVGTLTTKRVQETEAVAAAQQSIRAAIDATTVATQLQFDTLRGVTRELSAQEKFAQRVEAAFGKGAIDQALEARRRSLEKITDELVEQIQALESSAVTKRGDDGGKLARERAAAAARRARAEASVAKAAEKVETLEKRRDARAAARFKQNRQLALDVGDLSEGKLPTRTAEAKRRPVDAAEEEKLSAALRKQVEARRELEAAKRAEAKVEGTVDRDARASGQIAAIQELRRRLAEVIKERQRLGDDAGVDKATKDLQRYAQAFDDLQRQLSQVGLTERKRNELLAQQGRLAVQARSDLKGFSEAQGVAGGFDRKRLEGELGKSVGFFTRTIQNAAQDFGRRFRTTLQFAISGAILFGAQRLVREFFQAAIEVERAFADIESALVFDIDAERGSKEFRRQTESVRQQVLLLANEFNVLPTEANQAAFEMIARFKDTENAMIALRAQLLSTKIATIDMSESLRSLTATAEGFVQVQDFLVPGLDLQGRLLLREAASAEIYGRALDNAVVIQQNWGLAVEDTIEASGRAAGVLGNLGFSLEQSNALIAAVAKGLGIPGSQAVEKINRAFGRILDPDVRDDLLEIAKANESFFLSFSDFQGADAGATVFQNILDQADDLRALDPNTFTEIVKAIGGDREAEIVFTALSTGDVQRDALARFEEGADAAEERFKFLAVTISETIASLSAGFQELAQNFQRLGLIFPFAVFLKSVDLLLEGVNTTLKVLIRIVGVLDGFTGGLATGAIRAASLAASFAAILFTMKALASVSAFGTIGALVTSIQGTSGVAGVLARTFGGRIAAGSAAGAAAGGGGAGIAAFTAALVGTTSKMVLLAGAIGGITLAAGAAVNVFFQMRDDAQRFADTLREFGDLAIQRRLLGPEPGETQEEFAARVSELNLQDLDRLELNISAGLGEQFGDFFIEAAQNLPFGATPDDFKSRREQEQDIIDSLREIASRTQVRAQTGIVGRGLRALPADLTDEQTQRAVGISRQRIDIQTLLSEAETPEDFAEVVRLSQQNFDNLLGLQRELEAQALEFAESLRSIDKNIAQARAQRDVGDISAEELTAILRQQLSNARRILAEDPGNQDAQQKILDIRKQLIEDQTAGFERIRQENSLIASETKRLEADMRLAAAELSAFFVSFGAGAEQFAQLVQNWVTAVRAFVDAVQSQAVALAQARLGAARNVNQFAARSRALAAALRKQANTLEGRGDDAGAELKRIEASEVEFAAQQRVFADRTNLLVQKRIASAKVNDEYAAAQADLIRIGRELTDQNLSEADRLALQNEQRRAQAQAASILLGRYRAAAELAAGTRNSMLRLKAEITILARELEFAARTQGTQSTEWQRLKLAQERAQDELVNAMLELEDLNRRLDSDITNDLAQAELDLVDILRQLQIPDLGELEKARIELERANAEAALEQAFFDDRLFQLRFQFETGELGTSAYIAALSRLQDEVDLSTQQGMEIFLQIENIINGLSDSLNNLAFNIPTAITLPTIFEVRRALAADQLGVNYQDNRQIDVNINVANTVDLEEALAVISDVFGKTDALEGQASAPGQFAFTIGGF